MRAPGSPDGGPPPDSHDGAAEPQQFGVRHGFTISVEARHGVTTGISAFDRARTIQVLTDPGSRPHDLVMPGHIFPLRAQRGVLVYLKQEGRGIGLTNKIRAYALQDLGQDTVDANLELGFSADERSYEPAVAILRDLGITSLRLMTNNPEKVAALTRCGLQC
jgi:GTP cyclohydrolase II/3,4-dihydroxy-2-butanone 4-phosphate synthase